MSPGYHRTRQLTSRLSQRLLSGCLWKARLSLAWRLSRPSRTRSFSRHRALSLPCSCGPNSLRPSLKSSLRLSTRSRRPSRHLSNPSSLNIASLASPHTDSRPSSRSNNNNNNSNIFRPSSRCPNSLSHTMLSRPHRNNRNSRHKSRAINHLCHLSKSSHRASTRCCSRSIQHRRMRLNSPRRNKLPVAHSLQLQLSRLVNRPPRSCLRLQVPLWRRNQLARLTRP